MLAIDSEKVLVHLSDRVAISCYRCGCRCIKLSALVGINFFPKLDDVLENQLEKSSSYKDWAF